MNFSPDQLCALSDFVVLHIRGTEAASFLQSQLTNAVEDLAADQAVLAGFCQAQGRLQATLTVWADPQDPLQRYALIHRSIAEAVRKRLSMFLLRTKAELIISPATVYGLSNKELPVTTAPVANLTVTHLAQQSLISACSSSRGQAWLIDYEGATLNATASANSWLAQQIYAGVAWLDEAHYESFLPQDINLDLIGGVSFKKGCFPGQEVIARLHYRSTAKRRAAWLQIAAESDDLQLSTADVYDANHPDRPIGRVINSVYDPDAAAYAVLASVSINDLDLADLHVLAADGPSAKLNKLPYTWEIAKY